MSSLADLGKGCQITIREFAISMPEESLVKSYRGDEQEATLPKGIRSISDTNRCTVRQLLNVRNALVEQKKREKSARGAIDRARLERERAESRANYLDDLARLESPS
jgi:hypothetical protein